MTMKKFEKIRSNILLLHELNTKKVEKEDFETPGPGAYNPTYRLIEDDGFAVK